jgi:hypothetical protein
MEKKNYKKYLTTAFLVFVIAASIASMIPLLGLSYYDHPSADDYSYTKLTCHIWQSTRSIPAVIAAAVKTSADYWTTWQGLYSSAFILALQPGIFGEKYYKITGALMFFIMYGSNLYFAWYWIRRKMKGSRLEAIAIGCIATLLMIQFMPSVVEGLYWFNGAMNYEFFYGVLLFLICWMDRLRDVNSRVKNILFLILLCLTGSVLEGGNQVMAFLGLLITAAFVTFGFRVNEFARYKKLTIVLVVMVAGFIFNVTSPGTKERAGRFSDTYNVVETIWYAIKNGIGYLNGWVTLFVVLSIVLMLPFILGIVKHYSDESGFRFPCPLLVSFFSIGVICTMLCPPLYAMGNLGAGRLTNVVYECFVILAFLNTFYISGWFVTHITWKDEQDAQSVVWKSAPFMAVIVVILILQITNNSSGKTAYMELIDGSAAQYSQEAYARYDVLIHAKGQDVTLNSFSVCPSLLYFDDITDKKKNWKNKAVKEYYDLKSVVKQ